VFLAEGNGYIVNEEEDDEVFGCDDVGFFWECPSSELDQGSK
jgi:hypothetical protein